MNNRLTQVGFSQRIRLEWLERTANLVLAGSDDASVYRFLEGLLRDELSVGKNTRRGSREKAITILMKIWVRPPRELRPLQREGLRLLTHLPQDDRIVVHWGMTMAVYPFWGAVATHVGRLLRLQGSVRHAQVRRRIMERYGQRPTVRHAVRRVLRSMVDWGVLKDVPTNDAGRSRGIYISGVSRVITEVEVMAWLAEAFLHAHPDGSVALRAIFDAPGLFPFRFSPVSGAHLVATSDRLDVLRHGLDQELLLLRRVSQPL